MINIIDELREAAGGTAKQAILRKHRGNSEWLNYLKDVYNPFVVYGKSGDKNGGRHDLENLKLCRSIDAGITATTINKVYPGLIPTGSKLMKALDITKSNKELSYPLYASIKYDGHYTNVSVLNGVARFFTSGGHEYTVKGHHPYMCVADGVYMAERHGKEGKLGHRRLANLRGSRGAQYSKGHSFKTFNYCTHEEYTSGKAVHSFSCMYGFLEGMKIKGLVERKLITSHYELYRYLSEVVQEGWEGLVLAQPDLLWRDSKSRKVDFCKLKKRPTADLLCIEEIEGEGKNQGSIGALLLQDSKGRTVNVGSGLSDDDRLRWGCFIGKVVEIQYEQIMDTYIQPTFLHVRGDKSAEDID